MFSEILLAKCFLYADKSVTAEQYLFNNLNITYRPLWTYSAERKGASVIYFNWAASFSDFLSDEGYKSTDLGEKLMSYTEVLQWSPQYAAYLKSIFSSEWTTVKVVPPIYYSDSGIIPEPSVKPVIVVFDVTPQRRFFHDVIVPFVEYRTVENGRKFLEDLYEVARELGFEIVWKAKRSFTTHHSKEYIKFSNNFVKLPGVIAADPGTSAFRLVQKADFVVSMPFTSTSLIGDVYKVPSAYYDPSLIIKKNDRGANGLALLSGKEELKQWIVKNKKII
jgi:polysaccharide biosynthesis PFTS motif protein